MLKPHLERLDRAAPALGSRRLARKERESDRERERGGATGLVWGDHMHRKEGRGSNEGCLELSLQRGGLHLLLLSWPSVTRDLRPTGRALRAGEGACTPASPAEEEEEEGKREREREREIERARARVSVCIRGTTVPSTCEAPAPGSTVASTEATPSPREQTGYRLGAPAFGFLRLGVLDEVAPNGL